MDGGWRASSGAVRGVGSAACVGEFAAVLKERASDAQRVAVAHPHKPQAREQASSIGWWRWSTQGCRCWRWSDCSDALATRLLIFFLLLLLLAMQISIHLGDKIRQWWVC